MSLKLSFPEIATDETPGERFDYATISTMQVIIDGKNVCPGSDFWVQAIDRLMNELSQWKNKEIGHSFRFSLLEDSYEIRMLKTSESVLEFSILNYDRKLLGSTSVDLASICTDIYAIAIKMYDLMVRTSKNGRSDAGAIQFNGSIVRFIESFPELNFAAPQ